jgi:hypothetical protein
MKTLKKSGKFLVVLLACLILSGCQSGEKEQTFLDLYPGVDFNQEIDLVVDPSGANTGFLGSEIDLLLENQSSKIISYSLQEGTSIYTYSEKYQKWVKLENQIEYEPGEDLLYSKESKDKLTIKGVFVVPKIYDYSTPIIVRIATIGHQTSDGKPVGAYYDVKLVPQY